jgi:hypothetical protein
MSLLGLMRGALPGAVAARAGYLHGQDEQRKEDEATKRQTLLDQMKAAMNQSQIEENKSRAKYYEQIGNAKENPDLPVTWKLDGTTGGYTALPTRMRPGAAAGAESKSETTGTTGATGTTGPSEQPKSLLGQMKGDDFGGRTTDFEEGVRAGAGTVPSDAPGTPSTAGTLLSRMKDTPSAVAAVAGVRSDVTAPPKPLKAPPTPKGPTLRRAGVVNPASGNLEDVYSDGSRKVVRVATDAELARANHVPSSGARGAAGPKPLNPKQVEDYLNSVADKAIRATGGDAQKAAEAVLNDPVGRTAYDHGLATRHFLAAKQRFDRQAGIDRDTHDINPDGTPIVTTPSGRERLASSAGHADDHFDEWCRNDEQAADQRDRDEETRRAEWKRGSRRRRSRVVDQRRQLSADPRGRRDGDRSTGSQRCHHLRACNEFAVSQRSGEGSTKKATRQDAMISYGRGFGGTSPIFRRMSLVSAFRSAMQIRSNRRPPTATPGGSERHPSEQRTCGCPVKRFTRTSMPPARSCRHAVGQRNARTAHATAATRVMSAARGMDALFIPTTLSAAGQARQRMNAEWSR